MRAGRGNIVKLTERRMNQQLKHQESDGYRGEGAAGTNVIVPDGKFTL